MNLVILVASIDQFDCQCFPHKSVHLGGHRIVSDARDILILILETHAALYPDIRWAAARMDHELNDGYAIAGGTGPAR